jgi:hypothetical protein
MYVSENETLKLNGRGMHLAFPAESGKEKTADVLIPCPGVACQEMSRVITNNESIGDNQKTRTRDGYRRDEEN